MSDSDEQGLAARVSRSEESKTDIIYPRDTMVGFVRSRGWSPEVPKSLFYKCATATTFLRSLALQLACYQV